LTSYRTLKGQNNLVSETSKIIHRNFAASLSSKPKQVPSEQTQQPLCLAQAQAVAESIEEETPRDNLVQLELGCDQTNEGLKETLNFLVERPDLQQPKPSPVPRREPPKPKANLP
jgi:hypothetical protein